MTTVTRSTLITVKFGVGSSPSERHATEAVKRIIPGAKPIDAERIGHEPFRIHYKVTYEIEEE